MAGGWGRGPSPPAAHTQTGLWALSPQSLPWPGPGLQHRPLLGQEGCSPGADGEAVRPERVRRSAPTPGEASEKPGCLQPAGGGEAWLEWGTLPDGGGGCPKGSLMPVCTLFRCYKDFFFIVFK